MRRKERERKRKGKGKEKLGKENRGKLMKGKVGKVKESQTERKKEFELSMASTSSPSLLKTPPRPNWGYWG